MKKTQNRNKVYLPCECGYNVSGNSKENAEANLKIHKNSALHKTLLSTKQGIISGAIVSGAMTTPKISVIKKEGGN